MKTLHLSIIIIVIVVSLVTFGSYIILNPIISNNSSIQNVTASIPPPSGYGCHKWTQSGWIIVPCSTPSLPH